MSGPIPAAASSPISIPRSSSLATIQAPSSSTSVSTQTTAIQPPTLITPRDWSIPSYLTHSSFSPSFQVGGPASTSTSLPPAQIQTKTYIERLQERIDIEGLDAGEGTGRIPLPSRLDQKQCCKRLHITNDTRVQFLPERDDQGREKLNRHDPDKDAAAVRADHPIPPQTGVYYFEVEIISKGQKGYIGIGFSTRGVDLERLPGWNPESWAYHGDDGKAFACSGTGQSYGPRFSSGDIIGCGIDFLSSRAFFVKNGQWLGYVFDLRAALKDGSASSRGGKGGEEEERPAAAPGTRREREWQKEKKARENRGPLELFPTIGLQTVGETVKINFGQERFRFDIESFVKRRRQENTQRILEHSIPDSYTTALFHRSIPSSSSSSTLPPAQPSNLDTPNTDTKETATDLQLKSAMENLISGYLSHRGFTETSRAFRRQREVEKSDWAGLLEPSASSSSASNPARATDSQEASNSNGLKGKTGSVKKKKSKAGTSSGNAGMGLGSAKTMKSAIRTTLETGERSEVDQVHEEEGAIAPSFIAPERRGEDTDMESGHPASGAGTLQDDLMMTDVIPSTSTSSASQGMTKQTSAQLRNSFEEAELTDTSLRQRICSSLRSGDVESAIAELEEHYPSVLLPANNLGSLSGTMRISSASSSLSPRAQDGGERRAMKGKGKQKRMEEGMDILFRLRCRKFIELVLKSAAGESSETLTLEQQKEEQDGGMALDDDDAEEEDEEVASSLIPSRHNSPTTAKKPKRSTAPSMVKKNDSGPAAEIEEVLSYGARLNALYPRSLSTPEVRRYLDLVFSLVAYEDPGSEPGELGELCRQERREEIAEAVNRAMLESQGRPGMANLELIYRQAYAVKDVLGGVIGDARAALVGDILEA